MKKISIFAAFIILTCLLSACAKGLYRPLTQEKSEKVTIIAPVQCNFYSMTYLGAGRIAKANKEQAYIELMKEAKKQYQGNFDVKNISVAYVGINLEHGNEFTANGTVILIDN
jgi:hypothetical protein